MPGGVRRPSLEGRRVLIAEDELLLALEMKRTLEGWGCAVLGPVPSVTRAMALLERERPDAVLLDLNLKGESATPVATALSERALPFVLVTGYSATQVQEPALEGVPHVDKPVDPEKLAAALAAALGLGGASG